MLLQFFKHANGKFILLIFVFILFLRAGLSFFLDLNPYMVGIAYLFHSVAAVFINRIFTKNLITKKYSILPAFIFILLTSAPPFLEFNTTTAICSLFCLSLVGLSNIYPAERVNERLFNAGLILSLAIIINPVLALITSPLIFIFQVVYNANQIRRVLISITAILIPILIYLSFKIVIFGDYAFTDQITQAFRPGFKTIPFNFISLSFALILSILSLFDLQLNFQHKKILSRKFILLTLLLGSIHAILIFTTSVPLQTSIFLLLPITLLLANYFEHVKAKWIHELLFILFILISFSLPFL